MEKILIAYNYILHYRKPFFNKLSEHYNVTVLHSGDKTVTDKDKYEEILFGEKKIGPFHLQSGLLKEVGKNKYDCVIALFDVRWLTTILSYYLHNQDSKFIWWGAWITQNRLANTVRLYLTKKADANIFYTYKAKREFIERGANEGNLFVANNTFDVGKRIESFKEKKKTRILFVGSFDERKQLDSLIYAFNNVLNEIPDNITLTIIGDGNEKDKLQEIVNKKNLKDRVDFEGRINDPVKLHPYYREAIASVSFGQAGLSVLQSLGFGVPFITKKNAISGGEKFNIKHGFNGLLCDDKIEALENSIKSVCNDITYARELGKNAYNYYNKYCTIENMVHGFVDAIENSRLSRVDKGSSENL